jgi:DNA-binding NtrC family response regulator
MKQRLLVIDDERPILTAVAGYFRRHGYEVACAQQPAEAEALLAEGEYACVITDLRLSARGSEGLALAARVLERSPGTRVVILTAYGSPTTEKEARALGVDAFIHKPKPLAELARVIERLVGRTA